MTSPYVTPETVGPQEFFPAEEHGPMTGAHVHEHQLDGHEHVHDHDGSSVHNHATAYAEGRVHHYHDDDGTHYREGHGPGMEERGGNPGNPSARAGGAYGTMLNASGPAERAAARRALIENNERRR
jgi:hypothetical protein